jgi:hypothetical protein
LSVIVLLFVPQQSECEELISQVVIDRPTYQTSQTYSSTDVRINLGQNESASIDLQLAPGNGIVHLVAPNGGSINNQGSELAIDTAQQGREINFTFTAGGARGRYTVEISEGQTTRTLEFWIGSEPPQGQPGPNRTFLH